MQEGACTHKRNKLGTRWSDSYLPGFFISNESFSAAHHARLQRRSASCLPDMFLASQCKRCTVPAGRQIQLLQASTTKHRGSNSRGECQRVQYGGWWCQWGWYWPGKQGIRRMGKTGGRGSSIPACTITGCITLLGVRASRACASAVDIRLPNPNAKTVLYTVCARWNLHNRCSCFNVAGNGILHTECHALPHTCQEGLNSLAARPGLKSLPPLDADKRRLLAPGRCWQSRRCCHQHHNRSCQWGQCQTGGGNPRNRCTPAEQYNVVSCWGNNVAARTRQRLRVLQLRFQRCSREFWILSMMRLPT